MNKEGKIFGIGLSRTGTTSLAKALEALTFRTLHSSLPFYAQRADLFPERSDAVLAVSGWQERFVLNKEIKAARVRKSENLIRDYDAFCDLPFPLFYKELDHMFPGSKFILTTRPFEGWLKSMRWMLNEGGDLWSWGYLDRELLTDVYGGNDFDEDRLYQVWECYHEAVREYFKGRPSDYLEMDISKGDFNFSRLSSFLEVANPQVDFPKTNEARKPVQNSAAMKKLRAFSPMLAWGLSRIIHS